MRTLLNILLISAIAGIILGSCRSRRDTSSNTIVNIKDSFIVKDSFRIKDSTRIIQKDSTVIREGISTGTTIAPCDGKLKAFSYRLNRGNFRFSIWGDTTGLIQWDINIDAEIAYREKMYSEFQQHIRDSFASIKEKNIQYITKTKTLTVTRYVWPWWVYGLIAFAVIALFLKFQYPIKRFIQHHSKNNQQ